ncbi:TagF domain-containing protein [Collimonas humicola]|uniref:TagF domain-containing protein n=1 Tax=Collimonas humicola TaxID=2825886 RepID=UPI001B8C992D|nr:TagF domain-containing protein [Collimonas humicola]
MAMWLPGFLRESTVSNPTLWGKMPSRGDFIRHNVKHAQSEALQAWIDRHLQAARPVIEAPAPQLKTVAAKRKRIEDAKWSHLTPIDLVDPREIMPKPPMPIIQVSPQSKMAPPAAGHAGLPWCFVLPPGSFPFAAKEHVIGVWMASSDKIGRIYPLVMMQTASPRWIKQYFKDYSLQPCDWLFAAARAMAHAVYAEETELDRPEHQQNSQKQPDRLTALVAQLEQLWALYQPGWRGLFGNFKKAPEQENIQRFIPSPHREDPIHRLHGVRYLPWADWPQRLTGGGELDAEQRAAFWQQDLQGRFVGAAERMRDVV